MRQRRVVGVFLALMLGFAAVFARLVELQVVEGAMWLAESERSMASFRSLGFERGLILDRRGEVLALDEQVADLEFRYRGWRRGTVAGQASHAWETLGLPRASVPAAVSAAGELVAALGEVTVGEIIALEPRQRRIDLGFYVGHLLGEDLWERVVEHVRDDTGHAVRLADLPEFAAGLQRSRERALAEHDALSALAAVVGRELPDVLDTMEGASQRALARVEAGLADELGNEREAWRRRQQLHAEFDDDPVTVAGSVSYDACTLVAIRGSQLSGLQIAVELRRAYPAETADVAALLVGTVGEPRPEDIGPSDEHRRRLSDLSGLPDLSAEELHELEVLRVQVRELDYVYGEERGRLGIEAAFERVLRGKRGWEATTERADGTSVLRVEPQRGLNVVLTLDVDLQRAAEEVLDALWRSPPEVVRPDGEPLPADVPARWSGAIVLLDPRDGAVLALASGPRAGRDDLQRRYGELLLDDPHGLLRHRAISPGASLDLPPPGSTFKPVAALAGLQLGRITPETRFLCEGELPVGDRTMGCLGFHGEIALHEALARSCNIYFYRLGRALGADALAEAARAVGFGGEHGSGLVLGNETLRARGVPLAAGVYEPATPLGPAPPWSTTDAMRLAIGQAPLDDVTPLQVASMLGALGTGVLVPPSLVAEIEGFQLPPRPARPVAASDHHLQAVREGLAAVVDSPVGTAYELSAFVAQRMPWLSGAIAAKTGTAEVGGGRTHAWMAGYLPRHSPRLAFAVLVEDCALHGGEAARPVFEWLLEKPAVEDFLRLEVFDLPAGERAR